MKEKKGDERTETRTDVRTNWVTTSLLELLIAAKNKWMGLAQASERKIQHPLAPFRCLGLKTRGGHHWMINFVLSPDTPFGDKNIKANWDSVLLDVSLKTAIFFFWNFEIAIYVPCNRFSKSLLLIPALVISIVQDLLHWGQTHWFVFCYCFKAVFIVKTQRNST